MADSQAVVRRAVLDANILLQAPIRDTILRLAQAGALLVLWTDEIMAEVERNFAAVSGTTDARRRFARLRKALAESFPAATVTDYEHWVPSLSIASHDRHVLACAIQARAEVIVTYNLRDFPLFALAPYQGQVWHPDMLLRDVLDQHQDTLRAVLAAQGAEMHPPRSLAQVVNRLARDAPRFATRARERFGL